MNQLLVYPGAPPSMAPRANANAQHGAHPTGVEALVSNGAVMAMHPAKTCIIEVLPTQVTPTAGWRHAVSKQAKKFASGKPIRSVLSIICERFSNEGTCPDGEDCPQLHLVSSSLEEHRVLPIHVNTTHRTLTDVPHDRLLPGVGLRVWFPGHLDETPQPQDSSLFYQTRGSCKALRITLKGPRCEMDANHKPQHCTHYLRDVCLRGPECVFLHVVNLEGVPTPLPSTPAPSIQSPSAAIFSGNNSFSSLGDAQPHQSAATIGHEVKPKRTTGVAAVRSQPVGMEGVHYVHQQALPTQQPQTLLQPPLPPPYAPPPSYAIHHVVGQPQLSQHQYSPQYPPQYAILHTAQHQGRQVEYVVLNSPPTGTISPPQQQVVVLPPTSGAHTLATIFQ